MEDSNKKIVVKRDADRIGDLPDSVLHYILSFLEMKQVVASSLVSPRWRNLWVSVPVLNFDHSLWKTKNRLKKNNRYVKNNFMDFVDKVLFLQDGSSVTKFKISCSSYCDFDRFGGWMTIAARKQICEIHIDLETYTAGAFESRELPDAIFCTGVTVFEFNLMPYSSKEYSDIRMPTSISSSPHLKTLVLSYVELPQGDSNGELVLSCPLLETLELVGCKIGHLSVLDVSTPQLKNLVIYVYPLVESCQIKILTPILESLRMSGQWNNNFSLGILSSLVYAKLGNFQRFSKAEYLIQFLESISCATKIELTCGAEDISDMATISFSNLRCLKLGGVCDLYPTTMLKVFESSPSLETLVLNVYNIKNWRDNLYYFNFHHLRSLEIGRFNCYKYEINFLEYLLEKAVVLEKLKIRMGTYKGKFVDRMQNLVKVSSSRVVLSIIR